MERSPSRRPGVCALAWPTRLVSRHLRTALALRTRRCLGDASLRVLAHSPFFARRLFGHESIVILDLLESGFALGWDGEGKGTLVELKWEDTHIAIKSILGHLQIPFPRASHQLPIL